MTNVIVRNSTSYKREDLVPFTKASSEMKYARAHWGKDKTIKCTDFESASVSDSFYRKAVRTTSERFSTKESYTLKPTRLQVDSFTVSDDYSRRVNVLSGDTFLLTDSAWLLPKVISSEKFGVIDQDERLPNTVLYDLEIDNGEVLDSDKTEYFNSGTPLNYSDIRPLYAGEYEYKNAIVGIQLSITPSEGRFGIIGSTLNIDIEDTVAKGQVTVGTNGSTLVKFAECNPPKHFYTIPQVLTSLVEASEPCSIEITEITRLSFKVALKSNSSGLYVDGTINWLADGY